MRLFEPCRVSALRSPFDFAQDGLWKGRTFHDRPPHKKKTGLVGPAFPASSWMRLHLSTARLAEGSEGQSQLADRNHHECTFFATGTRAAEGRPAALITR